MVSGGARQWSEGRGKRARGPLLSGAAALGGVAALGRGRRWWRVGGCARTSVYVVNHGVGHGWGCGSLSSVVGGLPG